MLAQILILASMAVILAMGSLHLFYTFFSTRFSPRDAALEERLKQVPPNISRATSMWKAWVGFNASHSLGVMMFALVYGELALRHFDLLAGDLFLAAFGAVLLACYLMLARRYWFSAPFRGLLLALLLYAGGMAAAIA